MGRMTDRMRPAERARGDVMLADGLAVMADVCVARGTRLPANVALNNLRGVVILIVLGFHSTLAYLGSAGPGMYPFDVSPYEWRAFPIVDAHRWYGFDLFCAWQDVYLMALMFFLSALHTWPSLARKGERGFLRGRALRLGGPFVLALTVVMPLALYPVYRVTAIDPSLGAYARHFWALPFWPNGPMWFLWLLLGFAVLAAGLHRFAPGFVDLLDRWSARAAVHPVRALAGLVAVSAMAYVPLELAFSPWAWNERGPFAFQLSRPLLYGVYYIAGLGVGAHGLGRGLLAPDGALARAWPAWLAAALGALLLWMGLTSMVMKYPGSAPLGLQIAVGISFVAACACGCFFVVGACLKSDARRSPILASLARNAFGMYVFHYIFVVWLQYMLLGIALFAIAKASIVFGGTLLLAWGATVLFRWMVASSRGASAREGTRVASVLTNSDTGTTT